MPMRSGYCEVAYLSEHGHDGILTRTRRISSASDVLDQTRFLTMSRKPMQITTT